MNLSKKEILWALSAGSASALVPLLAIIFASVHPILISIALFFPLPIYLTHLSQGVKVGGVATLVGALGVMLWGSSGLMYLYAFITLPAYFLCSKALLSRKNGNKMEFYPESLLIQLFSLLTAGLCLLVATLVASIDMNDLTGRLSEVKNSLETLSPGQSMHFDMLIPFIPAMISLNWAGMQLLNAICAQKILEKKKINLRSAFSLQEVRIRDFWMYALAGCGVILFLLDGAPEKIAMNLALVLMVPYWFIGLGTLHLFFRCQKPPLKNMIWGVYILIFLIPVAHLIIVALGIFEPWIKMRSRIKPSSPE